MWYFLENKDKGAGYFFFRIEKKCKEKGLVC